MSSDIKVESRLVKDKMTKTKSLLAKHHSLCTQIRNIKKKISPIEKFQPLALSASDIIDRATSEENVLLEKILGEPIKSGHEAIGIIRRLGSNSIASAGRLLVGGSPYLSYRKILNDIGTREGVKEPNKFSEAELEAHIIQKKFNQALGKMSDEDRRLFESKLLEYAEKHGKNFSGEAAFTISAITAQTSGFGVYLMASTLIGSLSGAVGVVLPFAFFSAMSQVISVCIGPIGWAVLGLSIAVKAGAPNYNKVTSAIITIANIRLQLEEDRREKIYPDQLLMESLMNDKKDDINKMAAFLNELRDIEPSIKYPPNKKKVNKGIGNIDRAIKKS